MRMDGVDTTIITVSRNTVNTHGGITFYGLRMIGW